MSDDPDKMSEHALRLEVKSLRERLDKLHGEYRIKVQAVNDEAFQAGYDKGFAAGGQHQRARFVGKLKELIK